MKVWMKLVIMERKRWVSNECIKWLRLLGKNTTGSFNIYELTVLEAGSPRSAVLVSSEIPLPGLCSRFVLTWFSLCGHGGEGARQEAEGRRKEDISWSNEIRMVCDYL